MSQSDFDRLAASKYLSLTTFRKSGAAVATPVWLAADSNHLYVITERTSGKAKRLRNSGRVLLAPCDSRGRMKGDQVAGSGKVLDDPADVKAVLGRIEKRYGWMAKLFGLARTIRRTKSAQVGLEITVGAAPAE